MSDYNQDSVMGYLIETIVPVRGFQMDASAPKTDRSAFGPADVLAGVAIAVVLISVLIPGIRWGDSAANRALCAGNLRRIVQSEVSPDYSRTGAGLRGWRS